jgi:outer membrane protein assembly factor BamB
LGWANYSGWKSTDYHFTVSAAHELDGPVEVAWMAGMRSSQGIGIIPVAVVFSPDGQLVVMTGWRGDRKIVTIAYDAATGKPVWKAVFGNAGGDGHLVSAMVPCPSGERIYLTAWKPEMNRSTCVTLAYDLRNGQRLWDASYPKAAVESSGHDLTISPDGTRLYVLTRTSGEGAESGAAVAAYDAASGGMLWVAAVGRIHGRRAGGTSLGISPDGKTLFVGGALWQKGVALDCRVSALDAETGENRWTLAEPAPENLGYARLVVCPLGENIFASAKLFNPEGGTVVLAGDARTGERLWAAHHVSFEATDIVASADGQRVFLVAREYRVPDGQEALLAIAFDARSGREVWMSWREVMSSKPAMTPGVRARLSPDGATLFVLSGNRPPLAPFQTIAYDVQNGRAIWEVTSDSALADLGVPRAIAVSPDSKQIAVIGLVGSRSAAIIVYRCRAERPILTANVPNVVDPHTE